MKLPNELHQRALVAYGRAVRIVDPVRFQLWADRGLTMPQIRVLFELVEEGERSAGELAEALSVTPPTITGLTDRLVKQNLVQRREDARDRRVVLLTLTDEGRALTAEITEQARAYLGEVFDALPADHLGAICSALEDLAAANDKLRSRTAVTP